MNWGFWGTLADQAARGRAAHLSGVRMGEEDREERERIRRAEEMAARREQRDAAAAALREQQAELELAAAKRRAAQGNQLEGPAGRTFSDDEQGRRDLLEWTKQYGDANRAPRQPAADTDPYLSKNRERDYWTQVAEDLVAAHGNDALNVAARQDRPELREARLSGKLTPEMVRAAAARQRQGGRRGTATAEDPRRDAAVKKYGEPLTALEQAVFQQVMAGQSPAQIIAMMRAAGQPPEAITDAEMYLYGDDF